MAPRRPPRPAAHAAIVAALLELARPELLRVFRRDSCIASTRVALDVLKTFGIAARPLSVKAVVYNAPYAARLELGMPLPESAEEMACWVREDGAWSVGVGFPNPDAPRVDGWPGHLVAVTERHLLFDLALDQASRPAHGLRLGPLAVPASAAFLAGHVPLVARRAGIRVEYLACPKDLTYRLTPDWRDRARRTPVVERIVRQLRQRLRGAERSNP